MAAAAAVALCLSIPGGNKPPLKSLSVSSSSNSSSHSVKSLAFSSTLSFTTFPKVGLDSWKGRRIDVAVPVGPRRYSVVCEAAAPGKTADSAAKRARQAEKRRIYNKSKKSEVKTRMKKVFEELDVIKKKTEAQAEEILGVEKLIAEAYSAIDKAVKSGTLHRNTGANRKSRLARRKKAVEVHHGWYTPVEAA